MALPAAALLIAFCPPLPAAPLASGVQRPPGTVEIGDWTLRFPAEYIERLDKDGAILSGTYPGFAPRDRNSRVRGWNNDILVLIKDEKATGSFEWRLEASLDTNKPYHKGPPIFDLEAYISDNERHIDNGMVEDVYVRHPAGDIPGVIIVCDRRIVNGFDYPSCSEQTVFDHIYIDITFSLDLLNEWDNIRKDILTFITAHALNK